jgi:hypothetical protein
VPRKSTPCDRETTQFLIIENMLSFYAELRRHNEGLRLANRHLMRERKRLRARRTNRGGSP